MAKDSHDGSAQTQVYLQRLEEKISQLEMKSQGDSIQLVEDDFSRDLADNEVDMSLIQHNFKSIIKVT